MTKLNKALMASTAIAFASGLALPASAQDPSAAPGVVSSQKKVKIRLYGQISRAFGVVGDGDAVTFKSGENANTSTRMGIDGRGKITNDISIRTRMEYEVSSGDALGGSQFENQAGDASTFGVRHLDLIVSSKKFGSVWIGRGDSSSNGSSEVMTVGSLTSGRLGGTIASLIQDFNILSDDENAEPRAVGTVGRFFNSFDGANRQNRVRYDTPTFFGFKGSVSLIDKHNLDSAIWYQGKIAGTEIEGAVGFCHTRGSQSAGSGTCFGNGTTVQAISQLNGSVSVLTPIGLGVTMAGARQWRALDGAGHALFNNTALNLQPAIFYTTKLSELGATTLEYAFQYCEDCGLQGAGTKDDKGIGHSLQLMQEVDSVGGDYFIGFRYVEVEVNGNDNTDGLWFFGGGFRQKF
jgi:predicted porin